MSDERPGLFDQYPAGLYDGHAPHEPRDRAGTSSAAARAIEREANTLRHRVLAEISTHGAYGATDDEIERATGLRHQTASARRRDLVLQGLVRDSGMRRRTSSGRRAVVWQVIG